MNTSFRRLVRRGHLLLQSLILGLLMCVAGGAWCQPEGVVDDLPDSLRTVVEQLCEYHGPGKDDLDLITARAGFDASLRPAGWDTWTAESKLAYVYRAAESASPGGGERALALMARALAQEYASASVDPWFRALPVADLGSPIAEWSPPEALAPGGSPVPEEFRTVVTRLALYCEPEGVMPILVQDFGLTERQAFDLAACGLSHEEALTRGLSMLPSSDQPKALAKAVARQSWTYTSINDDAVLLNFLREFGGPDLPPSPIGTGPAAPRGGPAGDAAAQEVKSNRADEFERQIRALEEFRQSQNVGDGAIALQLDELYRARSELPGATVRGTRNQAEPRGEATGSTGYWDELNQQIKTRMTESVGENWTAAQEFQENFKGQPMVGGVILGSDVDPASARPSGAAFEMTVSASGELIVRLRVQTDQGSAMYDLATESEWVVARDFVEAGSAAIVSARPVEGENGMIEFALNPAVADSLVGWDAMCLDAYFPVEQGTVFPLVEGVTFRMPSWSALFWYDLPAVVSVTANGQLDISAGKSDHVSLMRVRFVDFEYPKWYDTSDAEGSIEREFGRRFAPVNRQIRVRLQSGQINLAEAKAEYDRSQDEILSSMESEFDDADTVIRDEESSNFNRHIDLVRGSFDSLDRFDSFARTVALLRWLKAELGRIPTLPPSASRTLVPLETTVPIASLLPEEIRTLRVPVETP